MRFRILVVDDSSTMRKIVMRSIRQAGVPVSEIMEASDGLQALEILAAGGVDMVLSDVNMPHMDGIEFIAKARELLGCEPPIVVITAEGSDRIVAAAMAGGASGYIKKPFTPDKIHQVVGSFLTG